MEAESGADEASKAAEPDVVARKVFRAGKDDKAAASIKRLGQSGQDAKALKDALKQVQHERANCVQELGTLKASIGKLGLSAKQSTEVIEKIDTALNSIADHLTDADIAGAMRDTANDPVRQKGSGDEFKHLGEVTEGLASLKNLREDLAKLHKQISKRQVEAKTIAQVLDPAMSSLQQVIQRVGQAIKKVKP